MMHALLVARQHDDAAACFGRLLVFIGSQQGIPNRPSRVYSFAGTSSGFHGVGVQQGGFDLEKPDGGAG